MLLVKAIFLYAKSPPSREAWIETFLSLCPYMTSLASPPSREAWIEIFSFTSGMHP